MLRPRTRSAAQRAPRAEQREAHHNGSFDVDEREPKRTKRGERTHAQAPASEQAAEAIAAAAANLYGFQVAQTIIRIFLLVHLIISFSEGHRHRSLELGLN